MSNNTKTGIISLYSDVKATPIKWLWYPFFAIGKISLLQGDPGDGKSRIVSVHPMEKSGLKLMQRQDLSGWKPESRSMHP